MQENRPTQPVSAKLPGNREENSSSVMGQTGEYFDFFHDCGGFLSASSGVYRRQNEATGILSGTPFGAH
jgi:hypothetical protein